MKTVISASRRTDIPAFYYSWLQEALKKGEVTLPNPMYPAKTYTVDLKPENVHSIVLWSKDFSNVSSDPGILSDYNLYFQYTVNNYSEALEPGVPEYGATLQTIEGLLKRYSPEQFNIRFDPIIISTKGEPEPTPSEPGCARLSVFERLCRDLKALGMDNCRITTSYVYMYGHVTANMDKAGLDIVNLDEQAQIKFFCEMTAIAASHGFSLYSCSSPLLERVGGIRKGRCIDGELLERLFGGKAGKAKDKGQRAACGCTASRDIGIYPRCPDGMKCLHGCIYCYVNAGRQISTGAQNE